MMESFVFEIVRVNKINLMEIWSMMVLFGLGTKIASPQKIMITNN